MSIVTSAWRPLFLAASMVAAAGTVFLAFEPTSRAQGMCRTVEVDMTPAEGLQMVMWLEDSAGIYVDTIYITALTGRYGLGNRPGRFDFNSGPLWPYGRRISTFPIWANRHGRTFPKVVYQNGDSSNLSHPLSHSSLERFYCRPIQPTEPLWDAMSCASVVYTDKGVLSGETSLYPPRSDLSMDEDRDHSTVAEMAEANLFDSVSQATPIGGAPYTARYGFATEFPDGDYVLFVEVSKEFDQNAAYDYPALTDIPWKDYGEPYRGQPSVLYSLPISIADGNTAMTSDYVGYGDPDGIDGALRPPDETISVETPGSGASRLLLTLEGEAMFRLRSRVKVELDEILPGTPSELSAADPDGVEAELSFIAPGEDDDVGLVSAYEIRYQAGAPITDDNWDDALRLPAQVVPEEPGTIQRFAIDGLLPQTNYYVGVRAIDNCLNEGGIETISFTTAAIEPGAVDYCFVATAAYGSLLANDVAMLRKFRDLALRGTVAGELAVAGYYTFGPALAKVIAPTETGRGLARAALAPFVKAARAAIKDSAKAPQREP